MSATRLAEQLIRAIAAMESGRDELTTAQASRDLLIAEGFGDDLRATLGDDDDDAGDCWEGGSCDAPTPCDCPACQAKDGTR